MSRRKNKTVDELRAAEAKALRTGILYSLRTDDFVILFTANKFYSVDELLAIVEKRTSPKCMLALNLYWISEEEFSLNFLFWEKQRSFHWL